MARWDGEGRSVRAGRGSCLRLGFFLVFVWGIAGDQVGCGSWGLRACCAGLGYTRASLAVCWGVVVCQEMVCGGEGVVLGAGGGGGGGGDGGDDAGEA